jgi:alpha-1,2-mannosyltransferase
VLLGVFAAELVLFAAARTHIYGFDFRGGAWAAGRHILAGTSPYIAPDPARLLIPGNAYIPPPPLAVLSVPLSLMPFVPAVVLWGLACTAGLVLALRVVGVRDPRVYGLALTSFPFVASIGLGQPDGLLALGVAVAWRYRRSWRGAAAVGLVIALKLLAWPLLIWLLATRRFKQAGVAAAVAVLTVAGSWSLIGFKGVAQYGQLLAADATAFQARSHSVVAAALRLGTSVQLARLLAIVVALLVAAIAVRVATDRDLGLFAAALSFGLLVSPILWTHYLVILFVPLAIARRKADAAWLLTMAYWISPVEPPWHAWQIVVVLAVTTTITVLSVRRVGPQQVRTPTVSRTATGALTPT